MLFYEHDDGGLYYQVGFVNLKDPGTGNWLEGISYRPVKPPVEGEPGHDVYPPRANVTTVERWEDRFTPRHMRTSEEAENAAYPWFLLGLFAIMAAGVGIMRMINIPPPDYLTGVLVIMCAAAWVFAWTRWQRDRARFDIRFRCSRP